jgi:hypothetical protein
MQKMRWLEPEVTVAPTAEIVTLDEAKAHLRVDDSDSDDADQRLYSRPAITHVEQYTGLALTERRRSFCAPGALKMHLPPAGSAGARRWTRITYVDLDGARQTLVSGLCLTALAGPTDDLARL